MFAGVDTGVDKGEWFTIRLVLKGTTVTAYIINDDGTARYITAVTKDDWADLSGCTAVAFIQDASTLNTLDVSYAYFGGDKQYVDPRASLPIPEGAFTFDDLENNDWVNGMGNADVVIGTSKQSSAVFTPTIVTDGDNKYFTVTKGGAGSGSSMAWVMIKSNVTVSEGETKVFQTKMAFNNTYAKSSVNIRIYNGRTVTNGSNGTELTNNDTRPIMTINSAGNVTVGGTATTAKADEWFYLRVVFDSVGATFYMVTEAGICVELCSVAGATADKATTIQFTSQAADMATYTFDYIYFGKAFEN